MALSRKPKQQSKEAKDTTVEKLILKGGSAPIEDTKVKTETIKFVQLRIPQTHLNDIDFLVKKRPGKLSRHTWIMEAIAEKINRDSQ